MKREKIELNVPWKDFLRVLDRRDEIEKEVEGLRHDIPEEHKKWCDLWDERHGVFRGMVRGRCRL